MDLQTQSSLSYAAEIAKLTEAFVHSATNYRPQAADGVLSNNKHVV